jgi:transposase-like protein
VPRVRDRGKENIKFSSNLIPQYMRRTVTIDVLLPLLYLKGISTTDFADSFEPILGSKPKNLSPNVISRLKSEWYNQYLLWQRRDLSKKKYVYFWVDGIYLQARMESEKNCILVIIGVDEYGKKEVVAIDDGFRESKESWQGLFITRHKKQRSDSCSCPSCWRWSSWLLGSSNRRIFHYDASALLGT